MSYPAVTRSVRQERPSVRSYAICALPRSGSTLLSWALDDTGVAGHPREYFGPRKASAYAQQWGLPTHRSMLSFLHAMTEASMTENGIFGLKIHWYDFVRLLDSASGQAVAPGPAVLRPRRPLRRP
jgi:LPS sulfotransferase NodH